jgi:hypothetical protein
MNDVPTLLKKISLNNLARIDVSLEGDWSAQVTRVWRRDEGIVNFSGVARRHRVFKPCMELYFRKSWVGFHCYSRFNSENRFNEKQARYIIDYVERKLKTNG